MIRTFWILSSVSLSLSLSLCLICSLFCFLLLTCFLWTIWDSLCVPIYCCCCSYACPGRGLRSGRILSLGSRFLKKILVLFIICEQTSQWLHVIIALILSYGFVKISRFSACSVTVCVQAGIDSWFKFRFFIGCEGTSGSFFFWQSKATMQDYNEVRCETDCRVKKLDTTAVLLFFGVPSDCRVVVNSISSL